MKTVEESVQIIRLAVKDFPETVVILGSGWNKILVGATVMSEISYADLFGVRTSVPGHEGKLVIARTGNKRVAFMAGRFHTYEGYTSEEVTRPIQVFARVGTKKLIVTAAAGALNEKYAVGDFVVLSDMITAFCPSPLTGTQFVDLSQAFDPLMSSQALRVCNQKMIAVHEGRYVFVRGPHFETPADKMLYRNIGGDVIGMSTVPETIMARSLQIRVLGISFVTNLAFVKHAHADVLKAAEEGSRNMVHVLKGLI